MKSAEAVLLDTDVFSYLLNERSPYGAIYKPDIEGKLVAVSFITVGEVLFGAEKRAWSAGRRADIKDRFRKVTILPYDYEVCSVYAKLRAELERGGGPVASNDLWIAACAVRHSIPLISNNEKHFSRIPGLMLRTRARQVREMQAQAKLEK